MNKTRRRFLTAAIAAPLASALPNFSSAQIMLGSASLTTVSDGSLVLPAEFIFKPMPQDKLSSIRAEFNLAADRLTPECNLALYRDGINTVLFDVGSGPDFMPTAGLIESSLNSLGLTVADVTHVVFTHAHPDHIWGLLDDFDEPLFYNATYMMGQIEWDYWWDPETVNTISDARTTFAVGAKRRMEAIKDQVILFNDGEEILPGIGAIATYGHTPGHMAFEVRNSSESALIVGDAIGNHHVAFQHPEWESGSDQDPAQAVKTRQMLFDRLNKEQIPVVGFHLPDGGMGRVQKNEKGFRLVEV